jgi:hypothetical protein
VFNGDRAVVLRRPGSEWADVPAVGECPKVLFFPKTIGL